MSIFLYYKSILKRGVHKLLDVNKIKSGLKDISSFCASENNYIIN